LDKSDLFSAITVQIKLIEKVNLDTVRRSAVPSGLNFEAAIVRLEQFRNYCGPGKDRGVWFFLEKSHEKVCRSLDFPQRGTR
jgi:hypothetical protein